MNNELNQIYDRSTKGINNRYNLIIKAKVNYDLRKDLKKLRLDLYELGIKITVERSTKVIKVFNVPDIAYDFVTKYIPGRIIFEENC